METKLTYLFGAGASAGAVPMVSEMMEDYYKIYQFVDANREKIVSELRIQYTRDAELMVEFFVSELRYLYEELPSYQSIDTLARMYYFQDQKKKYEITKLFIAFLVSYSEEFRQTSVRYNGLLAAILNKENHPNINSIPSNIRCISWNYDTQFERAYLKFTHLKSVNEIQSALPIYPEQSLKFIQDNHSSEYKLLKINGTASYLRNINTEGVVSAVSTRPEHLVRELPNNEHVFVNQLSHIIWFIKMLDYVNRPTYGLIKSGLKFAWDAEDHFRHTIRLVKEAIQGTTVLVVIGYSFPTFNRNVDRDILNSISPSLEKIYLQAPEKDLNNIATGLKAALGSSNKLQPELISSLDQFFIPPEY